MIYLIVLIWAMCHHEMWFDELQAWMIARDNSSLVELSRNLKYEGHPGLWHACLFFIAKFSHNPAAMQVFHLLLAAVTAALFFYCSPFSLTQRILFLFGYFPVFEYAVISRNYALGILLLFSFCIIFLSRIRYKIIYLSVLLSLMAHTNVYCLIIAINLAVMMALLIIFDIKNGEQVLEINYQLGVGACIFFIAVLTAILQITPPLDTGLMKDWIIYDPRHAGAAFTTILSAFIPLPEIHQNFWGTNLCKLYCNKFLRLLFSLFLFFFGLLLFLPKRLMAFLFCSGIVSLLAFTYMVFFGRIRHHGHLFFFFIACLWLSQIFPRHRVKTKLLSKMTDFVTKQKNIFLNVILLAQAMAAVVALYFDAVYPFSAAKSVADFIKVNNWQNVICLGERDYSASTVSAYLDRKFYYPRGERFGSFIIWNQKRTFLNNRDIFMTARELMQEHKKSILIILTHEWLAPSQDAPLIAEFPAGIVAEERYYLYLMHYREPKN